MLYVKMAVHLVLCNMNKIYGRLYVHSELAEGLTVAPFCRWHIHWHILRRLQMRVFYLVLMPGTIGNSNKRRGAIIGIFRICFSILEGYFDIGNMMCI